MSIELEMAIYLPTTFGSWKFLFTCTHCEQEYLIKR